MERRRQKNRNRRLMLALLMLLVSGIALTTATYAWFSANTVVKTEDIDVKVTASAGIAISANAVDFGKTISMSDVIDFAHEVDEGKNTKLAADSAVKNNTMIPEELSPVSTVGLKAGSWKFYKGQLGDDDTVTALSSADTKFSFKSSTEGEDGYEYTGGDYLQFDVYIRSGVEQDIKFNQSGTKVTVLNNDTDLDDAYLQSALRIGVQNMGSLTTTKNQQLELVKADSASTSDWMIFNPYPDMKHASSLNSQYASGESERKNGYYAAADKTTALGTSTETYDQFGTPDTTGTFVKYLYKDVKALKDADVNAASYFELMSPSNSHYMQTDETDGSIPDTKLFHLVAGITKVRIYIWLEGQDKDCVDAISVSDGLTISLGFEVKSA